MKYCTRCGTAIDDTDRFCRYCGQNQQPAAYAGIPAAHGRTYPAAPVFVWSLILFFFVNPVGTPLAAVSAVFATAANADRTAGNSRLRTARLLCILAAAADAVTLLLLITAGALAALEPAFFGIITASL